MAKNIAFVYGSFFMGDCERDIKTIRASFPKIQGLEPLEPVEGNEFDFNSLKDCRVLILCTSSQNGYPPKNFKMFAYNLLAAATTNPGCLKHMRHAVYGNGDETYFKTYMNMPRYMDLLLEKCGSRRFYARGETGEPHAPLDTDKCSCPEWVKGMWPALADDLGKEADGKPLEAVPWDALWAKQRSETHEKITQWDLKALEKKLGKPGGAVTILAKL